MCGRYYIDEEMASELEKLIDRLDKELQSRKFAGDVKPSMKAPVIYCKDRQKRADVFGWGQKQYRGNGLIINARAESIYEKKMFSESVMSRRCIIPASGFYEWDASKNKFRFTDGEKKILYMAGIYQPEENGNKFVIITTAANFSMRPIHDRMPVILREDMLDIWLEDNDAAKEILRKVPPSLEKHTQLEQMRLKF